MNKKILLLFLIFLTGVPDFVRIGSSSSGGHPIVIIANKANDTDNVNVNQIAAIYKGQMEKWDDGQRIIVVNRPVDSEIRRDFYRLVLKEEPTKKFLRPGSPIPIKTMIAESDKATVRFVATIPNAVAYIYSDEANDTVKVVAVDGKLPSDSSYGLK